MVNASIRSGSGNLLRLAEAARLLSVGDTTLKRWTETGRIPCVRTAGGHRRFLRQHILLHRGEIAPARTAAPVSADVRPPEVEADLADEEEETVSECVASLRTRSRDWAQTGDLLSASLLQEVCDRSAAGTARPNESDSLARAIEAAVRETVPPAAPPAGAPTAVLACPVRHPNTLGLTLIGAVLGERGLSVLSLGAGVPIVSLVATIRSMRPVVVALSVPPVGYAPSDLSGPAFSVAVACRETAARLVLAGGAPWPPICGAVRVLTFADLAAFVDIEVVPRTAPEQARTSAVRAS